MFASSTEQKLKPAGIYFFKSVKVEVKLVVFSSSSNISTGGGQTAFLFKVLQICNSFRLID